MAALAGGAGADGAAAAAAPRIDTSLDAAEPAPPGSGKQRRASAKRPPRAALRRGASGESYPDEEDGQSAGHSDYPPAGPASSSKRHYDNASVSVPGSGSDRSSLRVPPLLIPGGNATVGSAATSPPQPPQSQPLPASRRQQRLVASDGAPFSLGAMTFRSPRDGGGGVAPPFPTPSERDMRAIDGFFAHAASALPVRMWWRALRG